MGIIIWILSKFLSLLTERTIERLDRGSAGSLVVSSDRIKKLLSGVDSVVTDFSIVSECNATYLNQSMKWLLESARKHFVYENMPLSTRALSCNIGYFQAQRDTKFVILYNLPYMPSIMKSWNSIANCKSLEWSRKKCLDTLEQHWISRPHKTQPNTPRATYL